GERPASAGGDPGPADPLSFLAASPRDTYVLTRGDFLTPDLDQGIISAGTPAVLPPLQSASSPPNRLDLAHWITSSENPLTVRVRVNTIWMHLFGQGLVTTPTDFGPRAAPPLYPDLLDALARRFGVLGMSQKALIREMVLSSTYLQSSHIDALSLELDPENRFFSRQARIRLDAESVRDSTLFAGGLLNQHTTGPAIFPPLPPGLEKLIQGAYSNFTWQESAPEESRRRGLYVFHKRSLPYPSLRVFDWPAADRSQNGRARSLSPLQVFTTLHDPSYVEAAQTLAQEAELL